MPRLVVEPCVSSAALRRGLSPGAADEHGEFDGEVLEMDDDDAAQALVDTYPNVRWYETAADDRDDRDDPSPRAEADTDGVTYRCGVNDCSREVDTPGDTCWQHSDD